ncbi:hypothetical protein WR25_11585 [Diploscapter pachys]|uniref:Prohormone-4 n=1 Tax=Diploscapter pachys TaxID=2018661 RepID=A0A2A2KR90_9BILA|nr:hypothetical protein WR25_11585 [Diploscapter pachys]
MQVDGKRGETSAIICPTWHPFACPSGECLPIKYLCDGSADCSDSYDENHRMCTAFTRPPVEETAAFLQALLQAHGKDFLVKVFGNKAANNLEGMGGIDKAAVALSQSKTADQFANDIGLKAEVRNNFLCKQSVQ